MRPFPHNNTTENLEFEEVFIMKEKVVLAYSGGLDTTAIIPG